MGCFLGVILVLGFLVSESLQEVKMVSLPLGVEICGGDGNAWFSENDVFAFGFYGDPLNGDGLVVGIWYNLPGSEGKAPVWTVGGGLRVSTNSTFRLLGDGNFVLTDRNRGMLPVWSSNTANLGVHSARLLNNGNFVLVGSENRVVWESFRSPTNTLLPGQSLRFGQSLRAPSLEFIASYYSLEFTSTSSISLVWEHNVTYWTSDLSSGSIVEEARFDANGLFGLFDAAGGIEWYKLSADYKEPSVSYRHLSVDSDGNLRSYSWNQETGSWKISWQAVSNQCDVFGSCGLYSICSYNSTSPVCKCLPGALESHSCKRLTDFSNCGSDVSVSKLQETVLYGLYPPNDEEIMLSSKACQEFCFNDSSCFAATAKNDGSGTCNIIRTNFITGYQYSTVPATSFLKVCLVPEAVTVGTNPLHDITFPVEHVDAHTGKRKDFIVAVSLLLMATALIFLAIEMFGFWCFLHQRKQLCQTENPFLVDQKKIHYSSLLRLSAEDVRTLTKDFTVRIGSTIFKGVFPNNVPVAVKVLSNLGVSERDFQMTISILKSTHHRNLVSLKGFCFETGLTVVLYEYINGCSLDQWLFDERKRKKWKESWSNRINIAIGIARAVGYLHLECRQCIAHGNLKLKNILLGEDFVAKVTYYGLQDLLERGSSSSETLFQKDVYMFGEILLQLIGARRNTSGVKLYEIAYDLCQSRRLDRFIDKRLAGRPDLDGLERKVKLALWCMQDQPSLRPSIAEVVMVLQGAVSLDMPPKFSNQS